MFKPQILEETENGVRLQINNAIVLTVDNEQFDNDGEVTIDYDEKLLTAQEAQELTNTFFNEMVNVMGDKLDNEKE